MLVLIMLVSRPAAVAVKNGTQIADGLSITMSTGNKKRLDSSVFTIREKH